MRQSYLLLLGLLILGCGARSDAELDGEFVLTGGNSSIHTSGTGGFSSVYPGSGGLPWVPNTTYVTGGTIGITPIWTPPRTSTWITGGTASTVTWRTGGTAGTSTWRTGGTAGTSTWRTGGTAGTSTWITGGTRPTGGTSAVGGTGPRGGTTATAGTSPRGGTTATGGTPIGGTSSTGGASIGGTSSTGGASIGGTSSTGGTTGTIPSTLVEQACLAQATDACQRCLCGSCTQTASDCLGDSGCVSIVTCVANTKCIMMGIGCYAETTCKGVIDASGGTTGPSYTRAMSLGLCLLSSGCSCS
jgi:hypothetical protein